MSPLAKARVINADEAAALIQNGQTLATSGFVGAAHPEGLSAAIGRRFEREGGPRDLTLIYGAGQGDGRQRGLNHFARPGMLRRVIGGHWGLIPRIGTMALQGEIEAYNFPQGVICQLFRDIAAGRPGCVTHIGLGTFVDPQFGGGRLNDRTLEPLVERIELAGQTWLFYKRHQLDVGLIRATAADRAGNLRMEQEVILGEVLAIAEAVHNCGGIVIAQVGAVQDEPITPQSVRVPGALVDYVVPVAPELHDQTFAEHFNPAYCTAGRPAWTHGENGSGALERRIICSRACDEMRPGDIVNLGIGLPEGIGRIALERGLIDQVMMTIESGTFGGVPASGLSFGAAAYPQAIIDQPAMFDFYDGGGLDFAALGAAQIDAAGNVNVSKFGGRLPGIGGFMNISQTARRLVFCGTFTTQGLEIACEAGSLRIVNEGRIPKFVGKLDQITYHAGCGRHAQQVLYVTERAVFGLREGELELLEIAPGIDLQRDIHNHMQCRPRLHPNLRTMDTRHFTGS